MLQRDQDFSLKFVIGERIICVGFVAVSVNKGVMAHIPETETSCIGNWARGTVEIHLFPTSIQKSIVMGVFWISADEVRPRGFFIKPNDIREGRLEQQRLFGCSVIVKLQQRLNITRNDVFCPSILRSDYLEFGDGFKFTFENLSGSFSTIDQYPAEIDRLRSMVRSCSQALSARKAQDKRALAL